MPKTSRLHALINPDGSINRVEPNIDPTVQTKEGYHWVKVEETPTPEVEEGQIVRTSSWSYDSKADLVSRVFVVESKSDAELIAEEIDRRRSEVDVLDLLERIEALEALVSRRG